MSLESYLSCARYISERRKNLHTPTQIRWNRQHESIFFLRFCVAVVAFLFRVVFCCLISWDIVIEWTGIKKKKVAPKNLHHKKTIPNPYILIILIWVPLGRVRGSDACQHTQIQYMYPQLWCFYIKRYDRINWRTRQIRIKMWFVPSPSCIHTVICTKNHFSILLTYKKIEIFRRANWIFGAKWIWK